MPTSDESASNAKRLLRRRFLTAAASGAAATVACTGPRSRWRFLSESESNTLAALCDQIIPPDQDAGASQAGVVAYIDRQLMGPFRKQRNEYRTGLAAIDAIARKQHGESFAQLADAEQTDLLKAIDSGKLGDSTTRDFFALLINHTMQGYYGSPRHGGNRDWASWRMLQVPTAPVRGRLHYDLKRS